MSFRKNRAVNNPSITRQQRPCKKGYIWNGSQCVRPFQPASDDYDVLQDLIDINGLNTTVENLGHPTACSGYYICPGVDDTNPADICNSSNGQLYNPGPCVLWEDDRVIFLSIPGDGIHTIPESFGNLTELIWLNLNGNLITSFPESFGNLTKLDTLWMTGNEFESFPESIGDTALRILYAQGNNIQDLPNGFGQLSTMVLLVIYNNDLGGPSSSGTMNDDVFQNLTNLRILKMHSNPSLMELPESICNCYNLEELTAYPNDSSCGYGCTGLWFLPECLHELTNLWYLHLNGNQFETIDFDICSMTNLEEVYMNSNNLTGDLPECIAGMGFEYGNFQIARNKLWCDYSNPETGCEQGCAPPWFCDDDAFLNSSGGCSSSGYTNQRCD